MGCGALVSDVSFLSFVLLSKSKNEFSNNCCNKIKSGFYQSRQLSYLQPFNQAYYSEPLFHEAHILQRSNYAEPQNTKTKE